MNLYQEQLFQKIKEKSSDIVDFILQNEYIIFKMKFIINNVKLDILYLAMYHKNLYLLDFLVQNLDKCDLDYVPENSKNYIPTFFYAYRNYPKIAYQMLQINHHISSIIHHDKSIFHVIINDSILLGMFMDIYKEKMKIFVYDYIIRKFDFDFLLQYIPDFFILLFHNYHITNKNFIEYILDKENNKNNETLSKLII